MKRDQLGALLREVRRLAGDRRIIIVGSQCVYAARDDVPAEVVMSVECDLLLDENDPLTRTLDEQLGPGSPYYDVHELYVDTVPEGFPFLPPGWEERLVAMDDDAETRCLEVHDVSLSKLAAGRLKDYELVAALVTHGIVSADVLRERIAAVEDLRMRAILLARLQIVFESLGH